MQSAPELRVEAVDYVQQDLTGQAVNQTAETLAILVDTTAGAAELQAAKTIMTQVPNSIMHCSKSVTLVPSHEPVCKLCSSLDMLQMYPLCICKPCLM